jgi:hypothetical protein
VTSTVLDAALCLLLVSGGVVAVTTTSPAARESGDAADAAVETLSTTTATLRVRGGGDDAVRRHATLTGHLAAAVRARVELRGREITGGESDYLAAVAGAVRVAVGGSTQVVAVWRPYPDSPLSARVVVGPPPPPGVTVHAETTHVPSGVPPVRGATEFDSGAEFGRRVGDAVVAGLFPVDEFGYALDDPAVAPLARERYVRACEALGVEAPDRVESDDVRRLNARFADELGAAVAADVRRRPGGVDEVNDDVSTETVLVTVRTWS